MPRHATSTSFRKGSIPWNKNPITKQCLVCETVFEVPQYRGTAKYCSRLCKDKGWSLNSNAQKCVELFNLGKSAKEISTETGLKLSSVYWHLNQRLYRFGEPGQSKTSVVGKFIKDKRCAVCGWDRCLDAAHLIPASVEGPLEDWNLVPLCPNHHRLMDTNKLNVNEQQRLLEYIAKNNPEVLVFGFNVHKRGLKLTYRKEMENIHAEQE